MSHLLQMRGLKHFSCKYYSFVLVASFTDAWIETLASRSINSGSVVASFTDAWIETGNMWVKGSLVQVASFTDAWIETCLIQPVSKQQQSHLLQMRGLKLNLYPGKFVQESRIFYRCVD